MAVSAIVLRASGCPEDASVISPEKTSSVTYYIKNTADTKKHPKSSAWGSNAPY
jgi:hypothetical protein